MRPPAGRPNRERSLMRDIITLACTQCKMRNYTTKKNKRLHPDRVQYKKYCPRCNKHTDHKEAR